VYQEGWFVKVGSDMGVVVDPSAREAFSARELADAYKYFKVHWPQYLDVEAGLRASAYQFGGRSLLVNEEADTDVGVLFHPASQKVPYSIT
jgi:hypothetical protein